VFASSSSSSSASSSSSPSSFGILFFGLQNAEAAATARD
jgi:hypothetical protein